MFLSGISATKICTERYFLLAIYEKMLYTNQAPAGVMELVDVVDSKSTAGDSVPVRVRSPAPIKATENDTFSVAFIQNKKAPVLT